MNLVSASLHIKLPKIKLVNLKILQFLYINVKPGLEA